MVPQHSPIAATFLEASPNTQAQALATVQSALRVQQHGAVPVGVHGSGLAGGVAGGQGPGAHGGTGPISIPSLHDGALAASLAMSVPVHGGLAAQMHMQAGHVPMASSGAVAATPNLGMTPSTMVRACDSRAVT